jgi:hypothetical protein
MMLGSQELRISSAEARAESLSDEVASLTAQRDQLASACDLAAAAEDEWRTMADTLRAELAAAARAPVTDAGAQTDDQQSAAPAPAEPCQTCAHEAGET